MFQRMANGWELARESFGVLRENKGLVLFPLISGAACLLVLASFALPLWHSDYAQVVLDDEQVPHDSVGYLLLFAFYFANYFVITFFNSALVACAVVRFKGGDPTIGDGLQAAIARLPQILGWAAVSATVGLILKLIESRSEKVGEIVSGLLGMAWSVTTYFVVPVLVVEKVGPIQAVQRSLHVMRKTWGEALTANFGIGLIGFLFCLPVALVVILGFLAIGAGAVPLGAILLGLGMALFLAVSLVSATLNSILLAALYLYAAEGTVPSAFDSGTFRQAFTRK